MNTQHTTQHVHAQSFGLAHSINNNLLLRHYCVGSGAIQHTASTVRLHTDAHTPPCYSDAQLDDYRSDTHHPFRWHPPVRFTVQARWSHPAGQLHGTTGFGWWNYPFTRQRLPRPPRAIWFFYASPPSNMPLDVQTPGDGWKVATIDALHPAAVALVPFAPIVVPLMRSRRLYRTLWQRIQRVLYIREAAISPSICMTDWHIYTIEWGICQACFLIDGIPLLTHAPAPRGALCLVLWLDNQYLELTPWGRMRWGVVPQTTPQWLDIAWLAIEQP